MNFLKIICCGILLTCFACLSNSSKKASLTSLVNPFIGTGGVGHTFPGATLPFGMVQLSPDTRLEGWEGCAGYQYLDTTIYGFSHTHLSGTGISDYGDVLLMPMDREFSFNSSESESGLNNYTSNYDKSSETASPGYYEVKLGENKVEVGLTVTPRVGIHNYRFIENKHPKVILDLEHRDKLLDHELNVISKNEIEGYRISEEWAKEQHLYFVLQFSEDFETEEINKNNTKAIFEFNLKPGQEILVKVGVSSVSIEGARLNLNREAPHWDFEKYRFQADSTWEKALGKILVESMNRERKTIFYTSLYHSMIAPNIFSDVDGKFRGMDKKIYTSEDGPVYTVFSFWDTFRATHPLYTLIEQGRTNAFIRTILKQYDSGGYLPIWELAGNYTRCMIGYHGIPVIADAYLKGLRDYDTSKAMEAMVKSGRQDTLGMRFYKKNGCIQSNEEHESVSKQLEYSYDDWCIAMMAKSMGKTEIYDEFIERAQYYKNVFNPEIGFMQGRMNGAWTLGFDPAEVNFNFTEANSWQYSMFVPHDIEGMIELYGGEDKFEMKLDELFETTQTVKGNHQKDITGLIGQYAHGNEPSHHMAYLYNYIGKPYKTQERVAQIMSDLYQNNPEGLSGNEDCGQMSAWYVLSSMGIYSVTPGSNFYTIGTPFFEKCSINLENGNTFSIKANNLTDQNLYIQKAWLNGNEFNQGYLQHEDILKGGDLVFQMGSEPHVDWGKEDRPISKIDKDKSITPIPYFKTQKRTFYDSLEVGLNFLQEGATLYYRFCDSDFREYTSPIFIYNSSCIEAYADHNGVKSKLIKANYFMLDSKRRITIKNGYSNQYMAGGDNALLDLIKASKEFTSGFWQGYEGVDFEAIIDLGGLEEVNTISIGALQDVKSWIWFPTRVEYSISNDGINFKNLTTINNELSEKEYGKFLKEFSFNSQTPITTRYVKINAESMKTCPVWHPGSGSKCWLFFDEITIE